MTDSGDRLRLLRSFSCACPMGIWPLCGQSATCGHWERQARLQGVSFATIDGLTKPFPILCPGSPPTILLPAWVVGEVREYVVAWCLCEIARKALGDESIAARMALTVRTLEEAS